MTRINTNVQSLLAQRVLNNNNNTLNQSLERLSTGLQINRGADDPAGLIASENLRSEKAALSAAIGNAERADQVINIAEGGLQEINSLLLEVQSLVGQSANEAGLSADERSANQLQIDSILQTIDRIASATSFQGAKLLNGTFDFNVSSQSTSVEDFSVNAAKLGFDENRDVQVVITQSAQRAGLILSTGGALDLASAGRSFIIEVAGELGSREFSFASGATLANIASDINTFSDITGVTASASTNNIFLKSSEFGSDAFVSVDISNDGGQAGSVAFLSAGDENASNGTGDDVAFSAVTNPIRDEGQDVGAIINGVSAVADGRNARINTDFLDTEVQLTSGASQTLGALTAFTITGGGAVFNLGPNVDILNQVSIGIKNVATRNLGSFDNGFLSSLGSSKENNLVDGDLTTAQKVVNDAIGQVTQLRGRLGAFQKNIVGATIRSLGVALENTSAAESSIRDTDFATETAALTRGQILSQAATNTLGLANSQPQSVLSLLG